MDSQGHPSESKSIFKKEVLTENWNWAVLFFHVKIGFGSVELGFKWKKAKIRMQEIHYFPTMRQAQFLGPMSPSHLFFECSQMFAIGSIFSVTLSLILSRNGAVVRALASIRFPDFGTVQ